MISKLKYSLLLCSLIFSPLYSQVLPTATPSPTATRTPIPGEVDLKIAFEIQRNSGDQTAREWFEKAKEDGNIEGDFQLNLMDRYPFKNGVRNNDAGNMSERAPSDERKEALNLILDFTFRSAEQGNVAAEDRLWTFYIRDHSYLGYPADLEITRKWMIKAADQGSPNAQYNLANCYDPNFGNQPDLGIPKDKELARHWYSLAAAQGIKEAKQALERMDSEGQPLTCVGFIMNEPSQYTQNLQLESPVTLGGQNCQAVRLFPSQAIELYLDYVKVRGNLHWEGYVPQLKVEGVEKLPDQMDHAADHLTVGKDYVPGMVLVKFKDGTPEDVMKALLEKIGDAKPFVQRIIKNDYSIKLNKDFSVKDALKELLGNPAVEFAQPSYRDKWGFE